MHPLAGMFTERILVLAPVTPCHSTPPRIHQKAVDQAVKAQFGNPPLREDKLREFNVLSTYGMYLEKRSVGPATCDASSWGNTAESRA
jgi:hypothetical protein